MCVVETVAQAEKDVQERLEFLLVRWLRLPPLSLPLHRRPLLLVLLHHPTFDVEYDYVPDDCGLIGFLLDEGEKGDWFGLFVLKEKVLQWRLLFVCPCFDLSALSLVHVLFDLPLHSSWRRPLKLPG